MPLMPTLVLFSVSDLVFVGSTDSTYITIMYYEINNVMFNALYYWQAEQPKLLSISQSCS